MREAKNLAIYSDLLEQQIYELHEDYDIDIDIDIDLKDAEYFDSFLTVIFNCKIKHCCFKKAEQN